MRSVLSARAGRLAMALALLAAGMAWAGDTRPGTNPTPARQREAASKSAPARTAAAKSAPARQVAQPAMTDAQMEAAIRARFAKSKIGADKFQVHVQGGVATIEGRTDVIQHKGSATRMAKSAGAVAVSNHVKASDAAKAKASANLAKGRRRAQVKRGDARSSTAQKRRSGD